MKVKLMEVTARRRARLAWLAAACLWSAACSTTPVAPPAAEPAPAAAAGTAAVPAANAPDGTTGARAPTREDEGVMEMTRRSVRSTVEWLARGVDSWFGDKPFEEGGRVTNGRLGLHYQKRENEGGDFSVRFNARFRLPNVEQTAYLFIGRDNEREIITDTPGALTRQERLLAERDADRSFFAGLGLTLRDMFDFRIGFRGGLKPYAQARYRQAWQLGARDLLEFRETLFWTLDDHLGSTTALTYEHAYSPTLALRWVNAATISQESEKLEWSTNLGTYKIFGPQQLLSLEALANGRDDAGVDVLDYGLQARWEQPIYKDWLLGEVSFGRFYPRPDPARQRQGVWAAGVGVKMRF